MTPNATVYIAEDEPELRELLREALEAEGYKVETFPNGAQLLDRVGHQPPNLILLDLNMPGPSGWEVQEELKADKETASIPVIAVTAQGGVSVETSAKRGLGFTDFVQKPFQLDHLFERMDEALSQETKHP